VTERDQRALDDLIGKAFEKGPITDLGSLCTDVLQIPKIFKSMLKDRIQRTHATAYVGDKL